MKGSSWDRVSNNKSDVSQGWEELQGRLNWLLTDNEIRRAAPSRCGRAQRTRELYRGRGRISDS